MKQLTKEAFQAQARAKYMALYEQAGIDRAVTDLHREIGKLEAKIYDGGYEKERLERVQYLRGLARELFGIAAVIDNNSTQ